MKTWDKLSDGADDISIAIRQEEICQEMRMREFKEAVRTGGAATGGITVRDYFAAKAMDVYLTATMGQLVDCRNVSESAYQMADAMMRERERKQPEPCSVEEAFGL